MDPVGSKNHADILQNIKKAGVQFVNLKYMDASQSWNEVLVQTSHLQDSFFTTGVKLGDVLVYPDASTAVMNPLMQHPTLSIVCQTKDMPSSTSSSNSNNNASNNTSQPNMPHIPGLPPLFNNSGANPMNSLGINFPSIPPALFDNSNNHNNPLSTSAIPASILPPPPPPSHDTQSHLKRSVSSQSSGGRQSNNHDLSPKLTMGEMMNNPKAHKGTSCHQCKNTKPLKKLAFCANLFNKRTKPEKRICRKKYCETCLKKFYNDSLTEIMSKAWICASCRGCCSCAACTRTKSRKKQKKGDGAPAPISHESPPDSPHSDGDESAASAPLPLATPTMQQPLHQQQHSQHQQQPPMFLSPAMFQANQQASQQQQAQAQAQAHLQAQLMGVASPPTSTHHISIDHGDTNNFVPPQPPHHPHPHIPLMSTPSLGSHSLLNTPSLTTTSLQQPNMPLMFGAFPNDLRSPAIDNRRLGAFNDVMSPATMYHSLMQPLIPSPAQSNTTSPFQRPRGMSKVISPNAGKRMIPGPRDWGFGPGSFGTPGLGSRSMHPNLLIPDTTADTTHLQPPQPDISNYMPTLPNPFTSSFHHPAMNMFQMMQQQQQHQYQMAMMNEMLSGNKQIQQQEHTEPIHNEGKEQQQQQQDSSATSSLEHDDPNSLLNAAKALERLSTPGQTTKSIMGKSSSSDPSDDSHVNDTMVAPKAFQTLNHLQQLAQQSL